MLNTERLLLRHWQHSDLDHLHRLCSNVEVMRYFPNVQDRSASKQMLQRLQNAFMWHPDYGVWALESKQTGEFVGMLGLQNCNLPFDFMPKIEILWRDATVLVARLGFGSRFVCARLRFKPPSPACAHGLHQLPQPALAKTDAAHGHASHCELPPPHVTASAQTQSPHCLCVTLKSVQPI